MDNPLKMVLLMRFCSKSPRLSRRFAATARSCRASWNAAPDGAWVVDPAAPRRGWGANGWGYERIRVVNGG